MTFGSYLAQTELPKLEASETELGSIAADRMIEMTTKEVVGKVIQYVVRLLYLHRFLTHVLISSRPKMIFSRRRSSGSAPKGCTKWPSNNVCGFPLNDKHLRSSVSLKATW